MANPIYDNRESLIYRSILSADELVPLIQANYPLELPLQCVLLQSGVNDIYLVTAQTQKYILRVSHIRRYGFFDESAYRFELDLLSYLQVRGLPVSYPLVRRDNDRLGAIATPEGRRFYSLFSFAEGGIPSSLNVEYAYSLGEALAKIHLAMDEFPTSQHRFHLDEEFLINEPLRRLRTIPQIPIENISFLQELSETLQGSLQNLSRQGEEYGIIHGDFWWENVHFLDKRATFFDFDFCGYGWRAYDIGSLRGTAMATGIDLSEEVVDTFVRGYQSVRKLTEAELAALPAFEKIRLVWTMGLWTTFVNVLGLNWFLQSTAQIVSILKKWGEQDKRA
jgi:Ser/Thr protein kinase RdoA (MazF antagonist)